MRAVHVPLAPSLKCGDLPTLEPAGEEPDPPVGKREQAPRTPIESPHSAREPHLYSAGASPLLEWRRLPEEGLDENEGIVLKRRIQRSNVMRIRRTLAPGLLGLLGSRFSPLRRRPAEVAEAGTAGPTITMARKATGAAGVVSRRSLTLDSQWLTLHHSRIQTRRRRMRLRNPPRKARRRPQPDSQAWRQRKTPGVSCNAGGVSCF